MEGVEQVWSGLRGEAGVGVCRGGVGVVGLRGGGGWCVEGVERMWSGLKGRRGLVCMGLSECVLG